MAAILDVRPRAVMTSVLRELPRGYGVGVGGVWVCACAPALVGMVLD